MQHELVGSSLGEATITQFVDPLGGFYHLDIEEKA